MVAIKLIFPRLKDKKSIRRELYYGTEKLTIPAGQTDMVLEVEDTRLIEESRLVDVDPKGHRSDHVTGLTYELLSPEIELTPVMEDEFDG